MSRRGRAAGVNQPPAPGRRQKPEDSAVVHKLERDVQFLTLGALEEGDDGLQVVSGLGGNAKFVTLNLGFDALGAFLTDQFRDLLRGVLGDALLEGAGQLEELAGGLGLAVLVVEDLQGQAAADEFGLQDVEDGLRVKMCVWLGVSRGLDLAFLNAD